MSWLDMLRKSLFWGGILMIVGSIILSIDPVRFFFIGLGFTIVGTGFFKPNISSMVGSLYPKQEKTKLDSAFTIFYMGINLGAFLGQLICPLLGDVKSADGFRDIHAFKWGFLAASCAMVLGTLVFLFLKCYNYSICITYKKWMGYTLVDTKDKEIVLY